MTQDHSRRIIEALQADANLHYASEQALAELARHARLQDFDKGEYIFAAGDDSDHVYIVESGRVVLSKESPSGKVFTYLIALRGMTLNGVTSFMARRIFSARVAEQSTMVVIPDQVFRLWVLGQPEVASGIFNTMGELLNGAYARILDLIDESAENRILNALNMLSSRVGADLPLTNNDVAELTGVSRETAARVISNLQKLGLISKTRGSIRILDETQLKDLSTSPFFIL